MFNDPNPKVRGAIGWVFSRICEYHSDFVAHAQVIPVIMPVMINSLKDKPRVSNHICRAIEYLATSLAPKDQNQPANSLTPYFENLFTALIQNAYRTDYDVQSADLSLASFSALSTCCEKAGSNSHDVLYSMLIPILQLIEQTLAPEKIHDKRNKDLQNHLFGLL